MNETIVLKNGQAFKIRFVEDEPFVFCLISTEADGRQVARGSAAVCAPGDTFDLAIGKRVSMRRACDIGGDRPLRELYDTWRKKDMKRAEENEDPVPDPVALAFHILDPVFVKMVDLSDGRTKDKNEVMVVIDTDPNSIESYPYVVIDKWGGEWHVGNHNIERVSPEHFEVGDFVQIISSNCGCSSCKAAIGSVGEIVAIYRDDPGPPYLVKYKGNHLKGLLMEDQEIVLVRPKWANIVFGNKKEEAK